MIVLRLMSRILAGSAWDIARVHCNDRVCGEVLAFLLISKSKYANFDGTSGAYWEKEKLSLIFGSPVVHKREEISHSKLSIHIGHIYIIVTNHRHTSNDNK